MLAFFICVKAQYNMQSGAIVGAEVQMEPYRVGILGATGLVGQRLIERLEAHPWLRIAALAASERSADRSYADAVSWRLASELPRDVAALTVRPCRVEEMRLSKGKMQHRVNDSLSLDGITRLVNNL